MTTIASLFSGGGGWEVGAMALGVRPRWGVELDPGAAAAHDANVPGDVYVGSVFDVDPAGLARPDVLAVSPPCQAWSKGRAGRSEARCDADAGDAVPAYVAALRPRVVLLENVPAYARSAVFARVDAALRALGYRGDRRLVNARDVGVPQDRRRLVARYVRGDAGALPPWPRPAPARGWHAAVADLIPGLPATRLAPWQAARLEREVARGGSVLRPPLLVSSNNASSTRFGRGAVVRVARSFDEPAWTVAASWAAMSQTRVVLPDGAVRALGLRGLARLQTFPDSYRLPAANALAMKVIGNAVPPALATALLRPFLGA